jgi:radical SAM superfamily enzyme YgiQ (UPF0313 family)
VLCSDRSAPLYARQALSAAVAGGKGDVADIVLINPRFPVSSYGMEYALPVLHAKAAIAVAALPLLAALTPPHHQVTLIDENVEPIDYERCRKADIVGVTGMIVQRARMHELLHNLREIGVTVVVGGPWATCSEAEFAGLADVVFIGEAEETWPQFLKDWQGGRYAARYEQIEKTDMARVPVPRLDLLKPHSYAFGSMQFSRGCPFQCEFCDIIVVFGRRPRFKTTAQIIAELENLLAHGMTRVLIADDNLVGNKKAMRSLLRDIIAWQRATGYRMSFGTEASIDLADEPELLQLMADANVELVFIGIESTNEASLRETKKLQNLRHGGTMIEKVRRIQRAGLEVWGGMILGFDNDDMRVFGQHAAFISAARITYPLMNLLYAIPGTPLHSRLQAEGRLDPENEAVYSTNIVPLRIGREALRDGTYSMMRELFAASAFFDRVDSLYLDPDFPAWPARKRFFGKHLWRRLAFDVCTAAQALTVFTLLMRHVREAGLRHLYRRRIWHALRRRAEPIVLWNYVLKCAQHYHMNVILTVDRTLGTGHDSVSTETPEVRPAPVTAAAVGPDHSTLPRTRIMSSARAHI